MDSDTFDIEILAKEFHPVVGCALVRLARNIRRDRDDWEIAAKLEDFSEVSERQDVANLFAILKADAGMWRKARQRAITLPIPLEFLAMPEPWPGLDYSSGLAHDARRMGPTRARARRVGEAP